MRMTEQQYLERERRFGRSGSPALAVPPSKPAKVATAETQEPDTKKRLRALGRLKKGEMNKTETRYSQHLEAERIAGEIVWWKFECIKLRLYDNTHLTVDFFVMRKNGELECHDVKGSRAIVEDDALVKMKWAASEFPFRVCMVYPILQKNGGGWEVHEL